VSAVSSSIIVVVECEVESSDFQASSRECNIETTAKKREIPTAGAKKTIRLRVKSTQGMTGD